MIIYLTCVRRIQNNTELCVNRSRNIDTQLLCKLEVYCNCTQEVGNKIIKAIVY